MKNPAKISKRIFAYALVISLLISSDSFYAFASLVTNNETTKSDLHTASSNQFIELDDGNTDIDELGKYEDEEPQGDPEDFIYHDLTNQPIGGTVETDKGEMTWSIDSTGKLTVTGKGQPKLETKHVQYYWYFDLYSRDIDNCWPWAEYQHDIKSAFVDLSEFSSAENMFLTCSNLSEIEFGDNFDTSNVTNMESMFDGCRALTTLYLTSFNTSNVSDMSYMFEACDSLTELDLSSFDTSNVTNMAGLFCCCYELTSLPFNSWNNFVTNNVSDMSYMFYHCYSLTELDLSSFDTSGVTNMAGLFGYCYKLTSLPFNSWNNFVTNNVSDMSYMFYHCESLTELDLSSFDTSSVSDISYMFYHCASLTELDLSSFDTSSVSNMVLMFDGCDSLTELDLSSFNLIKLEYSEGFFPINCNLSLIIAPANLSNTIYLPNTGDWMDETGEIINILPLNQSKPIVIQKDVDVAPGAYNPVEIKTEIDKGKGRITPKQGAYDFRIAKTFYFIPNKDYEIESIIIDGKDMGNISSYEFSNENTDASGHTITAKFKSTISFNINLTNADNVCVNGNLSVRKDETTELSFKAKESYKIIDILVDGKSVGTVSTYKFENVTDNHEIEFKVAKEFVIKATNSANGKITPSGDSVLLEGENITYTFTPDKNYVVKDVLVDGKSVGALKEYTFEKVSANHSIEVIFAKDVYKVTFDANGGKVDIDSKEVTNDSAYGDLPVAAKNGFIFAGWYLSKEDGDRITKDSIFNQGRDITLYAHYDYINIAEKQSLNVSKFFSDVENINSYKVIKVENGKASISKKGKLKALKAGTIKVVPYVKENGKKVALEDKAITLIITKPKFTQKSISGQVGGMIDVSTLLEGLPANSNTVTYTVPIKKNPSKQVASVNETTGEVKFLKKGKTKLTVHVVNEDKSESKVTINMKIKK